MMPADYGRDVTAFHRFLKQTAPEILFLGPGSVGEGGLLPMPPNSGVLLKPGPSTAPSLHLYAHCLRDTPGGVALLAINTDRNASQTLDVSVPSERYTLTPALLR